VVRRTNRITKIQHESTPQHGLNWRVNTCGFRAGTKVYVWIQLATDRRVAGVKALRADARGSSTSPSVEHKLLEGGGRATCESRQFQAIPNETTCRPLSTAMNHKRRSRGLRARSAAQPRCLLESVRRPVVDTSWASGPSLDVGNPSRRTEEASGARRGPEPTSRPPSPSSSTF